MLTTAGMAFTDQLCMLCIVFISRVDFGTCADLSRDGTQPELFIFHESCALKKDEGPCKALHDRFYFDIDTGDCKPFEYGGCNGNANNFESLEACTEMCAVSADKSPCHLEEAAGPCRGLVTRYFYDSKSQACKHFYYGGCFGNANNFKSMKACQARCHKPGNTTEAPQAEVYSQAPTSRLRVTGNTTAAPQAEVYAQAPTSRRQVTSRLSRLQVTDQLPASPSLEFTPPDVCLSPIDKGTCDRVDRRFAYNPRTRRCQAFRYSGCGGNKNNFVHRRHCVKMCMDGKSMRDERKIIGIREKNTNIIFRSV